MVWRDPTLSILSKLDRTRHFWATTPPWGQGTQALLLHRGSCKGQNVVYMLSVQLILVPEPCIECLKNASFSSFRKHGVGTYFWATTPLSSQETMQNHLITRVSKDRMLSTCYQFTSVSPVALVLTVWKMPCFYILQKVITVSSTTKQLLSKHKLSSVTAWNIDCPKAHDCLHPIKSTWFDWNITKGAFEKCLFC